MTCRSACAHLANDLNPVAKHYILILYMKVAKESFADHLHVTARPGLADFFFGRSLRTWNFIE